MDDEGRSGVRSGNGLTPGVGKESRPEEERTFCVMKQTEYGEREDGFACGKLLEESQQTNWGDQTALVGDRDECSHERTQLRTSDEV